MYIHGYSLQSRQIDQNEIGFNDRRTRSTCRTLEILHGYLSMRGDWE